jgi:ankyrin repeat protein
MLIRAGADIEARDARGNTPLHRAALSENEEAINALLDAGANARAEVPLQETRKAKIRKARKDAEAFIQIVEAMLTPRYFIPDDSHIYRSETWWRLYELEQ